MTRHDELSAMLSKARRYLKSAETLRLAEDYDSAVSRLYYAMFYCAEALLFAKGFVFSSHRAVVSAFGQHYIKTNVLPAKLHRWLRDGFEQRQISDYEFVTNTTDGFVLDLIAKVEQFIDETQAFLTHEGHL